MAKLNDESAVELLMENSKLTQDEAWAKVLAKLKQEKAEKDAEEKKPKEETEWMVLVDDPKGKLPDNLTCYIIQKKPTCFDEFGNDTGEERKWGDSEIHTILDACAKFAKASCPKYDGRGLRDLMTNAKKVLKVGGIQVKNKNAVWVAGVSIK